MRPWHRVYFSFPDSETWFCCDFSNEARLWLFVAAVYAVSSEVIVSNDSQHYNTAGDVKPPRPNLNDGIAVEVVKSERIGK